MLCLCDIAYISIYVYQMILRYHLLIVSTFTMASYIKGSQWPSVHKRKLLGFYLTDITGRLRAGLWVISQSIFRPYHSKTIHLSYGRILGDKSHTESDVHDEGAERYPA